MGNSNMKVKFQDINASVDTKGTEPSGGLGSMVDSIIPKLPDFNQKKVFYTHFLNALYNNKLDVVNEAISLTKAHSQQVDDINKSKSTIINQIRGLKEGGGGPDSYYQGINSDLDKKSPGEKRRIFQKVETDPIFSPDNMSVTNTDRVIFIAMTFALRGITLFLIEWGIHSRMINTFENAFLLYFVLYLSLFIMWVVLVNANPNDIFFHSMFYYVNMDVKKAFVRCTVHCAAQLLVLPLPFVLRDQTTSKEALTFEERRAIISMLQRFTFFIWILTSVIAIRV